jgi:hypothetical protein
VAHLSGSHSLDCGGQRRVADSTPLVVVDIACLVLVVEAVTEPVLGQEQVGLFDHLPAIQVKVRRM